MCLFKLLGAGDKATGMQTDAAAKGSSRSAGSIAENVEIRIDASDTGQVLDAGKQSSSSQLEPCVVVASTAFAAVRAMDPAFVFLLRPD